MSSIPSGLSAALADKYRLERELGQGGMAVVYLATDLKHDRKVALKVMRSEMKGVLGPRFAREIRMAARLQHPHICSVYDSGETPEGELWYTMPFIEGESLRDRLTGEPRLPIPTAVRITREAAQGLEYAHKHGTIHRDIKPENILLTEDGKTLVADFGIARAVSGTGGADETGATKGATALTEAGVAIGTPAYMSPEQRMGETVTAASDVFSLGAVLYEMLAGERAASMTSMQSLLAQMSDPAPRVRLKRAEVSAALDKVLQTAMHPDPAKRFQSMAAFDAALESAASAEHRSVRSTLASRRWLPGAVGAVAVVALGVFAWSRITTASGPEVVTVLPFTLPESGSDSTLAYLTGSIGEDLRRMTNHAPGLTASAEAAVANVTGGRLSTADIAARMGSSIVVQPAAKWEDSSVALTFLVTRPPAKQSTRVEFRGTPQWIVDHRDSLLIAVLAAGGHSIERDQATSLVRWGIGTTQAPAYIRYWQFFKATPNAAEISPNWGPLILGWQDSLLRLDPRFIDALSDKVLFTYSGLMSTGMFTPAEGDSLRREAATLVKRAMQVDATHPLTIRASGYHSLMINDSASALRAFTESARAEPAYQTLSDLCSLELAEVRPSQPLPQSCVDEVRIDSLNPMSLLAASYMLLDAGRAVAALEPARRLVQITPNDVGYRGALIEALRRLGREEEALVELRRVLAATPNNTYFLGMQSQAQWNVGLVSEALATARQLYAINPGYSPAVNQLATVLGRMKQFPEAISLLRQAIAKAPGAPGYHAQLGNVLWWNGQFDEALAEFRTAQSLDPNSPFRRTALANFLRLAGKTGDAQGVGDQLQLQFAGAPIVYVEQGRQLAWLGRDAASVSEFRRAMGSDTLNASRWNSIGYAQILAGQLDSATISMRRAMQLDSFNTSVLSNMALLLSEQGSLAEAARTSDRMRIREPFDHEALAQQIWFHARAGEKELARAMLDTLQQRMQRNGVSELPMIIALAGVGDSIGARAALRRSVDARDYGWTSFSLGDPLFRMLRGTPEFAEAVKAFRQGGDAPR